MTASEQLADRHFDGLHGLTETDVASRLRAEGFNQLLAPKVRDLLCSGRDVSREPIILLLVSAEVINLVLGDLRDALVLMGSLSFVVGIGLYQHRKTEHAFEALRDLTNPRAMVIRDVQQRLVAGREVEPVATKLQGEVNWPAGESPFRQVLDRA
jgi:Ca2+-transporting ATPase